MKSKKLVVFAICSGMLFSFYQGMMTIKYKAFPYNQLQAIKRALGMKPSPGRSGFYQDKTSFFEKHGWTGFDVVFIGSSRTGGAEWQEMFPSIKVANRGISGDRADGVMDRLESIYSTSASKAFIMLGLNDISRGKSVEEVFDVYRKIVDKLVEYGMHVYVQSSILSGKRREYLNNSLIALNENMRMFANKNDSVTYIDINVGLTRDSLLNAIYTRDGTHLNGDGYAVWKKLIKTYIQ
jgi:lysophospholipase L1-like esterase